MVSLEVHVMVTAQCSALWMCGETLLRALVLVDLQLLCFYPAITKSTRFAYMNMAIFTLT